MDQDPRRHTFLLYALGFYLVALVFLLPHPGRMDGRSFIEVAMVSPWERWWDWPAAWCSVKIILLSIGCSLLLHACGILLTAFTRKRLGNLFLILPAVPALGFWAGLYYFIKAVL